MGKRIDVDWEEGGYVELESYCKLYTPTSHNRDTWFPLDPVTDRAYLIVMAGTTGAIFQKIQLNYKIEEDTGITGPPVPVMKKGSASYTVVWDYRCEPDGELIITRDRTGVRAWSADVSMAVTDEFRPAVKKIEPQLLVSIGLSYPEEGGKGELTVGYGPVSTGVGGSGSKSSGLEWGTRIDLWVTGAKAPLPPPPPKPAPRPAVKGADFTVYFEHEGQEDLDRNASGKGNTVTDLQTWVSDLARNRELYNAITHRYVPVHLWGYASVTDKDVKNFDLSEARIRNVQRRLRGMLGTPHGKEIVFNARPVGSREASKKEVPAHQRDAAYLKDRRVEVVIDQTEAADGIVRMRQGLPAM
jgi:hypothetical protein